MSNISNISKNKQADKKLEKPDWIRVKAPQSKGFKDTYNLARNLKFVALPFAQKLH